MVTKIKIDLEKRLSDKDGIAIEIGSGKKRRKASVITVDKVDLVNIDIVADIENGLGFLPDRCVESLYCRSVLEHIENFENLLREMLRVLKENGKAYIFVPHFSNPYYYSDYTHKRFFGLYSFYYFVEPDKQLRRKVPVFYTDIRLEIISITLTFKTPFWISRHLKKMFGMIVNSCSWMKEFYELHLSYLIPCDGIEIVLKKPQQKEEPVETFNNQQ
jgi:SAM-dependent methyltransferase